MSERPVVVGWDDSPGAAPGVRWAARTAARLGRELRIVRVVRTGPDPRTDAFAAARELVAEVAPGLTIDTKVINGHPIEALRDESAEAEMVVVGTRGHSRLHSTLVGSVGEGLTQHGLGPIVVVRGDTERDVTAPVVVGVDGSKTSSAAIGFAARFAEAVGASVLGVAAAPDPLRSIAREIVVSDEHSLSVRQDAERFLHEAMAGLRADHPDLVVGSTVLEHEPADALVQAADNAQLIVVGSHGRGGFAGMLLGSVSRTVLHHAPCPVAVVRPDR
ncbi:universal stress protein [Granulicoccus sp. GXG6511]|uniref:universal stress protein n=1 Tax=Granulicoccus sp. GXG6511 TaxID=3381351 RepID=UPI003D7D2B84